MRDHVSGFAELEAAVAPFTPRFAAERAGVAPRGDRARGARVRRRAPRLRRRGHRARTWRRTAISPSTCCSVSTRVRALAPRGRARGEPGCAACRRRCPWRRRRRRAARSDSARSCACAASANSAAGLPTAALADEILEPGRRPDPRADLRRQQSDRGLARSAQDAPRDRGARPARDARHEALGDVAARALRDRAEALARGAGALALGRGARADLRGDGLFRALRAVHARDRGAAAGIGRDRGVGVLLSPRPAHGTRPQALPDARARRACCASAARRSTWTWRASRPPTRSSSSSLPAHAYRSRR